MISVSDILKILDDIPAWLGLKKLPAKVDELERRIAALEKALTHPKKDAPQCALCGSPMNVVSAKPDPVFGALGAQRHELVCQNGHAESRLIDPP